MLGSTVSLYLDENLQTVIAEQLQLRGIDVVTVRDLNTLGDSDDTHLRRAKQLGRVFCTHDFDFVALAAAGQEHARIIIGQLRKHDIGDWVKGLELICATYSAEEMKNRVEYLP